jgi:hypothetical protein
MNFIKGTWFLSLDERGRRLHAAAEALTAGHGGEAATSRATKVARSTIGRGIKDLREPGSLAGKVRRKGAGRPAITTKDPTLLDDLRQLLEPAPFKHWDLSTANSIGAAEKSHRLRLFRAALIGFMESSSVLIHSFASAFWR